MKKRGFVAFNLAIAIMLMIILVSSTSGINMYYAYETKMAKEECEVLDRAINTYASYHKSMDEDSVSWDDENSKILYDEQRIYPQDKDELEDLQDAGLFTKDIDLSKYRYKTTDDNTKYTLEVTLPNDEVYKSTGSKK